MQAGARRIDLALSMRSCYAPPPLSHRPRLAIRESSLIYGPGFSPIAVAGMMMSKETTVIELDMEELQEILRRAEAKQFNDEDYETTKTVLQSYVHLVELLKDKKISNHRLRKMLFGASTEKTAAVLAGGTDPEAGPLHDAAVSTESPRETDPKKKSPTRPKGHGRNGADAYRGAEKIRVPHQSLQPGDPCPECYKGTVYEMTRPGVLVRITGQAPVAAKVYELQKLRCNPCGAVFTARPPAGVGSKKYDATAGSMIAMLKYGTGLPFNRMQGLQGNMGIPLPASTQWTSSKPSPSISSRCISN